MRINFILMTVFLFAVSLPAKAQMFSDSCASAIRFDSGQLSTNFASSLAVLDSINQSNFEEVKKNGQLSVIIYGFPVSAGWDEFNQKRSEFRRLYTMDQTIRYSSSNSWQAVSSASMAGYMKCLESNSNAPMIAAIVKATKTTIQINVKKKEAPGPSRTDTLQVIVDGGKLVNPIPIKMIGTSEESLIFKRVPGEDFTASISLRNRQGSSIAAQDFSVARYVSIVHGKPISEKVESGHNVCRATWIGNGDRTVSVVAKLGQRLMPETKQMDYRTQDASCPTGSITPSWSVVSADRVDMGTTCASTRAECTTTAEAWFTIERLTETYVEEKN